MIEIPAEIKNLIQDEEIDFCVLSKLYQKRSDSIGQIFGGVFLILFSTGVLYLLFQNIFQLASFTIEAIVNQFNNTGFMGFIFHVLVISIFEILGLLMFFGGIINLFNKGGYFIGTNKRFISFRKGKFLSYDWEQLHSEGVMLDLPDNLSIKLRTGYIRSSGSKQKHNYRETFIHDQFWMVGIENAKEIAKKCNIRVELNKV